MRNLADHAAPEIDATRVAEISASDPFDVTVPADTSLAAATMVPGRSVAMNPSTGVVNPTVENYLTISVKAGFISVGKTYFRQWLNGQYDFNSLMSSG